MVAAVYVAFSAHTAHVFVFWCVTYCYMYAKHNRSHCKLSSTQLRSQVIVMWFFRFLCVVMHISIYPCLYIYMLNIQRSISNVWNTIATSNVHSIVFEIALRFIKATTAIIGRFLVAVMYMHFMLICSPHFELCILTAVYMIFRTTIMRTQILRKATTT